MDCVHSCNQPKFDSLLLCPFGVSIHASNGTTDSINWSMSRHVLKADGILLIPGILVSLLKGCAGGGGMFSKDGVDSCSKLTTLTESSILAVVAECSSSMSSVSPDKSMTVIAGVGTLGGRMRDDEAGGAEFGNNGDNVPVVAPNSLPASSIIVTSMQLYFSSISIQAVANSSKSGSMEALPLADGKLYRGSKLAMVGSKLFGEVEAMLS